MDDLHNFAARGDASSLERLLTANSHDSTSASAAGSAASTRPRCDVNRYNSAGLTALHLAALSNHADAARVLIKHGAWSLTSSKGYMPSHFAAMRGHTAVLEVLLTQGGCDIDTVLCTKPADREQPWWRQDNLRCSSYREPFGPSAREVDKHHRHCKYASPLALACEFGHTDAAELCLAHGASQTWRCYGERYSLLHIAARYGHVDICTSLRVFGEHPVNVEMGSRDRFSPLATACKHGHIAVVNWLLDFGANPDLPVIGARHGLARPSSLGVAITHSRADVCRTLLDAGATVARDADGALLLSPRPVAPDGVHAVLSWLHERAVTLPAARQYHEACFALACACAMRGTPGPMCAALAHMYTDTPFERMSVEAPCYDASRRLFVSPCYRRTADAVVAHVNDSGCARSLTANALADVLCALIMTGARRSLTTVQLLQRLRMVVACAPITWARLLHDPVRIYDEEAAAAGVLRPWLLRVMVSAVKPPVLANVASHLGAWAWPRRRQAMHLRVRLLREQRREWRRAMRQRRYAAALAAVAAGGASASASGAPS